MIEGTAHRVNTTDVKKGEIHTLIDKALELSQKLEGRAKELSAVLTPISSVAEPKNEKEQTPYVTDVGRIIGNIIENMMSTLNIMDSSCNRLEI